MLGVGACIGFSFVGLHSVLLNLYLVRLGYGTEFIGAVHGSLMLLLTLFSFPAGWLGRRFGSRFCMTLGMGFVVVYGLILVAALGFLFMLLTDKRDEVLLKTSAEREGAIPAGPLLIASLIMLLVWGGLRSVLTFLAGVTRHRSFSAPRWLLRQRCCSPGASAHGRESYKVRISAGTATPSPESSALCSAPCAETHL